MSGQHKLQLQFISVYSFFLASAGCVASRERDQAVERIDHAGIGDLNFIRIVLSYKHRWARFGRTGWGNETSATTCFTAYGQRYKVLRNGFSSPDAHRTRNEYLIYPARSKVAWHALATRQFNNLCATLVAHKFTVWV